MKEPLLQTTQILEAGDEQTWISNLKGNFTEESESNTYRIVNTSH